jgi:hypothetical protein
MNNMNKPTLKARQEKFAQLVAQGISVERAYVEAGYKSRGHAANVNGSALLQIPHVEARVAEIREMAASLGDTLLTILEKRSFLAELVRTPAGMVGPDSKLCQDFYEKVQLRGKHKGDPTAGTEDGSVSLRRRVRMADKLRAIELDSKLAGHFPKAGAEPVEAAGAGPLTVDLEAIRKIAARLRRASPACAALFDLQRNDPDQDESDEWDGNERR